MGYLEKRIKNNITDRQKLIHTYISIIKDHNKDVELSYGELIKLMKLNFNFNATMSDIEIFFQPNVEECELDVRQQMNNLGIQYE